MLHPSIDELLKKTDSKYTLVSIAAQRARTLLEINSDKTEINRETVTTLLDDKPNSHTYVGMALEELSADKISYSRK